MNVQKAEFPFCLLHDYQYAYSVLMHNVFACITIRADPPLVLQSVASHLFTPWLNPPRSPWASAVHAAVCLTSEPLMHTDVIHQLLEPSKDFPHLSHPIRCLFEYDRTPALLIKNNAKTTNPFCTTEVTLLFFFFADFIILFREELSEQEFVLWVFPLFDD